MTNVPRDSFWRTRSFWASLALVALVFFAYGPALNGGFVWDDDVYVETNRNLRTLEGLRRLWFEPLSIPQYYPLVHTTFWIEYQLWGLDTLGYHLVNVALHLATAWFTWRVLRYLRIPGAGLAAALFAVHPVHVESVAWITERKNVLSGLFYAASFLCYLRFADAEPGARGRWRAYCGAALLFLAALLAKSVTASLPAAVAVVLWWRGRTVARSAWLGLVPLFVIGVASGLHTAYLERTHVGASGADWSLSGVERVLVAGRIVWFYATKLVWPDPLIFIYPRWEIDAGRAIQYAFPLSAILVVLALYLGRGRIGRGPLAAVLIFGGTLVPCLGFVDVFPMRFSFVADHFQYHASLALLTLFAALAAWATRSLPSGVRTAGGVVWVLALAGVTRLHTPAYESAMTLWQDTIEKNDEAFLAHNNIGDLLRRDGRPEEARPYFEKAYALNPNYEVTVQAMGLMARSAGDFAQAIEHYERLIELKPDWWIGYYNLAVCYCDLKRWRKARGALERLLERFPDHVDGRRLLNQLIQRGVPPPR